ncbi:DNA-binding response regulator [Cellulomonas shaoxiangyii]|uniref:response regulator transcription factor n=1 Tax=Cellulomonas shaoxiangyii TaxID=2566013 RepID=UPI001FB70A8B|nr:response regulator transcription factor [Cellulomonas shaoxiangyii]
MRGRSGRQPHRPKRTPAGFVRTPCTTGARPGSARERQHAGDDQADRALQAGVDGFLPKSRHARDVAEVIRLVAAGRRYVDPEVAADALADERSPLTDRELDVLRAGRRGETTAEIAASVHLSAGTVRNHVSSVLGKLGVATRQQAVLAAEERGWI